MTAKLPPHAVRVDGFVLPRPVADHPALDFCNTWAGWDAPARPGSEWLRGYDQFAVWAGFAGLLGPAAVASVRERAGGTGTEPDAVLDRVRRLRGALYGVLHHDDEQGFGTVAAEAEQANARTRLVGDAARARFELPETDDLLLPLHAVALSAADLLCGPDRASVRACPGTDCGWLFLDRRGRRTWCSMTTCGNRAKVRAHAARRRGTQR